MVPLSPTPDCETEEGINKSLNYNWTIMKFFFEIWIYFLIYDELIDTWTVKNKYVNI